MYSTVTQWMCSCSFHSWNFIHPHILSILSTIQVSVKYTLGLLQNAHSHTCIHTVLPFYLRLLLLGCDPVRPGWSGLWRFWKTDRQLRLYSFKCNSAMNILVVHKECDSISESSWQDVVGHRCQLLSWRHFSLYLVWCHSVQLPGDAPAWHVNPGAPHKLVFFRTKALKIQIEMTQTV